MRTYLVLLLVVNLTTGERCNARHIKRSSIICVCNSTYCDILPTVKDLKNGTYQLFTSTEDGLRLEKQSGSLNSDLAINPATITVDRTTQYQTILGFGGAFTDSTGINIGSLPEGAKDNLLHAYFSQDGAEINLGRVPIGGTDFSARPYTYAEHSEGTLDGFSLQNEDYYYKIPYILKAQNLTNNSLKLLASAWSSPSWMKTNNNISAPLGFLKDDYYQLWADYYVKFFDAYRKYNVTFWAVTTQNEPGTGYFIPIIHLDWTPDQLIKWLRDYFGPTIHNEYPDLKILIHDDQTLTLPIVQEYFMDDKALNYIDGVAVHGYTSNVPNYMLYSAKTSKKDVFLLQTETSAGFLAALKSEEPVELGSWSRASTYAKTILEFLNHDSIGWIDWNLALDLSGGPCYIDNKLDAPIIVNATAGEFYKQPTYYVLSHFSKYIPRGSVRIAVDLNLLAAKNVLLSAFLRPDGAVTAVLHNKASGEVTVIVYDRSVGHVCVILPPNSLSTLVYK